jgi:TonB family protein
MEWQDDEFEGFLRQFRPSKPKRLPVRRRAVVAAGMAGVAVLALVVSMRWQPFGGAPAETEPPSVQAATADSNGIASVDVTLATYSTQISNDGSNRGAASQVVMSLPAIPPRKTVRTVTPEYPTEAQRLGLEGMVELKLTVDRAGEVTRTERLKSAMDLRPDEQDGAARVEYFAKNPYALAEAAERAAKAWRFEPAPTGMTVVVSFAFRMKESADQPGSGFATGLPVLSSPPGLPRPGPPPAAAAGTAAASATRRLRVGGAIKPPVRLVNVNPDYPEEAQAAGIEGVVILEIIIATDGSVLDARVLRSIPELDQAAIDAVLQWQYEPTLLNGEPVELEMAVTINFTLR